MVFGEPHFRVANTSFGFVDSISFHENAGHNPNVQHSLEVSVSYCELGGETDITAAEPLVSTSLRAFLPVSLHFLC